MFGMSRKRAVLRASIVGVAIVGILSTIGYFVTDKLEGDVKAMTGAGDTVKVSMGSRISYPSTSYYTHYYRIESSSTGNHPGYCGEPNKSAAGNRTYSFQQIDESYRGNNGGLMRLLIFIKENPSFVKNNWNSAAEGDADPYTNLFSWANDENGRYVHAHAILGYLNSGEVTGLTNKNIANIKLGIDKLIYVRDNVPVIWQKSQEYQLFSTVDSTHQNIFWIEPKDVQVSLSTYAEDPVDNDQYLIAGAHQSIVDHVSYCAPVNHTYTITGKVMRKDGQGNITEMSGMTKTQKITPTTECGSIDMTFELNNIHDYAGQSLVIYETMTADDGSIAPIVHENPEDIAQTVHINPLTLESVASSASGQKAIAAGAGTVIKDKVIYCAEPGLEMQMRGKLYNKTTGAMIPTTEYSVNPVPFTASDTDTDGHAIGCGEVNLNFTIDTSNLHNNEIVVYLYLDQKINGSYVEVAKDENPNNTQETVTVDPRQVNYSVDTVATDKEDGDHTIKAGQATIVDTVHACGEAGDTYTIRGVLMDKSTGSELLVDNESLVETTTATIPAGETCTDVSLEFTLNVARFAGKDLVVFERMYMNPTDTTPIAEHTNISDTNQTIHVEDPEYSIGTQARDAADGDQEIEAGKAIITDHVEFCGKPGYYKIRGVLMDQETGEPLNVDKNGEYDHIIEASIDDKCGAVDMNFEIDATGLEGKNIVVFEYLYDNTVYLGEAGETVGTAGVGELESETPVAQHTDLNSAEQTIFVKVPVPETGAPTNKNRGATEAGVAAGFTTVIAFGGYVAKRIISRKKFSF